MDERDALRLARAWVEAGATDPLRRLVSAAVDKLIADPDERRLMRMRADNRFRAVTRPHPHFKSPFYGYSLGQFEAEERHETPAEALTRTIDWVIDCDNTHDRKCKCGGYREAPYIPAELPEDLVRAGA